MLKNLYIENVAVAKQIDVDFENGFTVITGETGAGKSVMIECLELLSGVKSSRDMIRNGESRAMVSAIFADLDDKSSCLEEFGTEPDENGELSIIRTISSDSRTGIKANGRSITLSQLKESSFFLLGINSQDEKTYLSDKNEYTSILDDYAKNESLLTEYRGHYEKLRQKEKELSDLKENLREKSMMTDILSYQIKEIDAAKLTSDNEEEKLVRLKEKIKNIERISKYQRLVCKALAGDDGTASASYLIEKASLALSKISDIIPEASEMTLRLDEFKYEIIDIAERVREAAQTDDIDDPEKQLNYIEKRLNQIEKLKRKYGATVEDIKNFRIDAGKKLDSLESGDMMISQLEKEIGEISKNALASAEKLHESRISAAGKLSCEITEILHSLDMPKARFLIEVITEYENGGQKFTLNGSDIIDFKISVNPGEPLQTLSKVASGGEMSRVMLALKCSVNQKSGADTVIFDEIDSGVSGSTSEKIGIMLKELSKSFQVICVTHSPQIAAVADHHYLIEKVEVDGRAQSKITELDREERIHEIARIIGGIHVTKKQLEAAREMLMSSKQ